jgi:hypothetical protein
MGVWGKVRVLKRKDGSVGKGKMAMEKERGRRRKVRRKERKEKERVENVEKKKLF